MNTKDEALRLALEWIEAQPEPRMIGAAKVVQSLREALAQKDEWEPVAWKRRLVEIHDALSYELGDTDPHIEDDMTDEEVREEMPVFWAAKEVATLIGDAPWDSLPSASPKSQPLTDDQIVSIAATPVAIPGSYVHAVARAIEAAHGIGVEHEPR